MSYRYNNRRNKYTYHFDWDLINWEAVLGIGFAVLQFVIIPAIIFWAVS